MSREQLIALVRRQDGQITALCTQVADLMEAGERVAALTAVNEELAARNEELATRRSTRITSWPRVSCSRRTWCCARSGIRCWHQRWMRAMSVSGKVDGHRSRLSVGAREVAVQGGLGDAGLGGDLAKAHALALQ